MLYTVTMPWLIRKLWPSFLWKMDAAEKKIYLTFDDGPHPVVTPFVLDLLKQYDAKASFFCIGKNVDAFPSVYARIIDEGHVVGNHTQDHLNGWKTGNEQYLANVSEAEARIGSVLFRPPYGKIRISQANRLRKKGMKVVMWSVLSGDFDRSLSKKKCLSNVISNTRNGSIVVFHDSEKAFPLLEYVLPQTLGYFSVRGYRFEGIVLK